MFPLPGAIPCGCQNNHKGLPGRAQSWLPRQAHPRGFLGRHKACPYDACHLGDLLYKVLVSSHFHKLLTSNPTQTMLTVIQRVTSAKVTVNHRIVGEINTGILALVAVEKDDNEKTAQRLLERILNYRIFADDNGRMNLSLKDIQGGLLLVPQFTLAANTEKGNRPSFASAAVLEKGLQLFGYLRTLSTASYPYIEFGEFGADMQVSLVNDGPVTFTLRTHVGNS